MVDDLRKKQRRKFRKFWTKREVQTGMYKRFVAEHEYPFLIEQAEKMEAWCAKRGRNPSLLRFNNWLKNCKEWGKKNEEINTEAQQQEEKERGEQLSRQSKHKAQ